MAPADDRAHRPARLLERLERVVGIVRGSAVFRRCTHGPLVYVGGPVEVSARGRVILGERVQFWPGMIPSELICERGGELRIGAATSFNYGVRIHATRLVCIGERCLFASMTSVRDSVGGGAARPVIIEDDVWVAYGASIEPGVRIGKGSVVAAGTVVRRDVPPFCLAVGDPAETRALPRGELARGACTLEHARGETRAKG